MFTKKERIVMFSMLYILLIGFYICFFSLIS
ncbi:MAG: hypothetical protein H6Q35_407 [Proteobacteria bacterium]|nr:hypothetical protein [Pseudomonadota bacterium]